VGARAGAAGIRVNAIASGPVDTPGFEKSDIPASELPAVKESFRKQVPSGGWGRRRRLRIGSSRISDPSTTWVTGQVFSVDGGMSLT